MKKLSINKMSNIEGGLKCLYHGALFGINIVFPTLYFGSNTQSFKECMNNEHAWGGGW